MHKIEKKEQGRHEGNLSWTISAGVDSHICDSQLLRPAISHFEQFSVCFLCSANTCEAHQAKVNSSCWDHSPSHPYVSDHMHYTKFRITDTSLKALTGTGGTRSFERYALLYGSNQTQLG